MGCFGRPDYLIQFVLRIEVEIVMGDNVLFGPFDWVDGFVRSQFGRQFPVFKCFGFRQIIYGIHLCKGEHCCQHEDGEKQDASAYRKLIWSAVIQGL